MSLLGHPSDNRRSFRLRARDPNALGPELVSQLVHERSIKFQVFLVNLDVEIAVILNLQKSSMVYVESTYIYIYVSREA